MHVNKPKDQDLDIQSPSSTSPLPWLSQTNRTSKNLSFPTGSCKNLNSHFTFVSFSLKEGARKLPWVFLSSPPVHTPKRKTKPHPKVFPLSHFLGCIRQKVQPSFSSPFSLFLFSSLFALTWQPPLSHQNKISLSKEEIKGLTLKFQLSSLALLKISDGGITGERSSIQHQRWGLG